MCIVTSDPVKIFLVQEQSPDGTVYMVAFSASAYADAWVTGNKERHPKRQYTVKELEVDWSLRCH